MKVFCNYVAWLFIALLVCAPFSVHAKAKPVKIAKERLVLMPLRVPAEDANLTGAMETALVKGLQQKYEVFSGEQVAQKARQIFMKESHSAKKECDETRCMQGIAETFQAELIATANITKQNGGYFLALSVQNIFDNKVVQSESVACKGCDSFAVVEKLKELVGISPSVTTETPAIRNPPPVIQSSTANNATLNITCSGNDTGAEVWINDKLRDECPVELKVPAGTIKLKIVKAVDANHERIQEQEVKIFEDSVKHVVAKLSVQLTAAGQAREEADLWNKADASNDLAAVETYITLNPAGRYLVAAKTKLQRLKEEGAKAQAKIIENIAANMVAIPGKNYEIGKYHVTKGEFANFVSETDYVPDGLCLVFEGEWVNRSWRNPGFTQDDTHPVTCVSWDDAQAYVKWLSKKAGMQYRLPLESEWEYACYGGAGGLISSPDYCGGDNVDAVAWYSDNSGGKTHSVGQKQANGYGLYDMSGNVWEWMQDWYDSSKPSSGHVQRGGSLQDNKHTVRASFRNHFGGRLNIIGFRLARTLP